WFDQAAGGAERVDSAVDVRGTLAADAAPAEGGTRLVIDVDAIRAGREWRAVAGRIQAHVGGALSGHARGDWTAGRGVVAPMTLRRPPLSLNFGGPSPEWQRLRRGFDLGGSIKSASLVVVTPAGPLAEAAAAVRARVRRTVAGGFDGSRAASGAVVTAILIGDRAGLDDDVERRLQAAGTYHVIAISGGNVALLTAATLLCLRLLIRSFRFAAALTAVVVLAYGAVVGGDPSVTRAVTVAAVVLGAEVMGVSATPLHVLGVAAAGILLADPLTSIDVGAWLSFGATLGILLFAHRLIPWVARRNDGWKRRAVRAAAALLAATAAAELALLPISALIFHRVGVAGLALNFIAIPAMAVIQFAGIVAVVVDPLSRLALRAAVFVAHDGVRALVGSAGLVDVAPWLSWRTPPVSAWWAVAYYSAIAGLIARTRGRGITRALMGIIVASGTVIVLSPSFVWPSVTNRLRLTMIDVGQGDGLLVQFPSGHSLLVDSGGTPGAFDVGERVVTPALWDRGVRRLDWLVFTHADVDHIGGASSVAATFTPEEIWEGTPVPRSPERARLWNASVARRRAWRVLRDGDQLRLGDVEIRVLHPPPPDWERQRVRNEDSVVLRIRYGVVELLLTGDIGSDSEAQLPVPPPDALIRVLKVAHHGSRTSTSAAFVHAYAPDLALVSAGRGNLFGHPAADVLARLRAAGARVFRTDEDGAISVETDGEVVVVQTRTGRRWQLRATRVEP
ncbi:MAG TPA: DNA internalization-related competence protein ComEC/Rec2, partial [Vicinamibacterales bacterium]|nr:DNA internalization-related competence protein ComEC/Rec2 [Vicinamibacterales bacterium]